MKPTTDLHQELGLLMRFLIDFIMYIELKAFASVTKKRFLYAKFYGILYMTVGRNFGGYINWSL